MFACKSLLWPQSFGMLSHSIVLIMKSQVHTHRPPWHTMTGPALKVSLDATRENGVLDSKRQGDGDASEEGGIFLMMPLLMFLIQHNVVFPGSFFFFFHLPQQLPLFSNCFNSTTETRCYYYFFFFFLGGKPESVTILQISQGDWILFESYKRTKKTNSATVGK